MSTVGTIVVKPEELVAKSAELHKKVTVLKSEFERMNNLMQKTNSYWLGEAGNYHRDMYNRSVENEAALLKSLEEYSNVLVQVAANYESTEGKLVAEAGALPNDILA